MEVLLITAGILLIQLTTAVINLKTAKMNRKNNKTFTRQIKSKSPNRPRRLRRAMKNRRE